MTLSARIRCAGGADRRRVDAAPCAPAPRRRRRAARGSRGCWPARRALAAGRARAG
ncbi:MAG: hypothetical protein MZW92_23950 [Comamonadaceae bacterium]|nr:hypothetical protein [Comamonadaceae bacterium]